MTTGLLIDTSAVYDDQSLKSALGLSPRVLVAARKAGTLRYSQKGRRILYLGQWVLEWLESDGNANVGKAVAHA